MKCEKQVETLAKEFVKNESSEMNLVHFNKLDKEIMDYGCVSCAAKIITKKKLGSQMSFAFLMSYHIYKDEEQLDNRQGSW